MAFPIEGVSEFYPLIKIEEPFGSSIAFLSSPYLRYFELVPGVHVIFLASALRAFTVVWNNDELIVAVPADSFGGEVIDGEFTLFQMLAFLDGGWPTFKHIPGDNSGRFSDLKSHGRNFG